MQPRMEVRRRATGGFMSFHKRTGIGYITRPSTRVFRTYIHLHGRVRRCVNVCPTRRPRRRSKRCTNFAGYGYVEIKKKKKKRKTEEAITRKRKGTRNRKERRRTHTRGKNVRCIYVYVYIFIHISEFKFRILRWHMAPGDATIGVPWSTIGCSFRSRCPSIFEQDRPKMSRGTVTERPFPSACIYPGKGGSTLAVNSK